MTVDWLKLHRKSIESRVFSDAHLWRLWCWCLIKSNWKRGWYGGCELLPGQFAIGREAAAEELGVSGSAWYRGMQKLQEIGCVRLTANNRFTIVSITNWHKYQGEVNNKRTTDEQQADNERTTGEQQADTIEEGKEFKERKNYTLSHDRAIVPTNLDNPEFAAAWQKWRSHRNDKHKPLGVTEEEEQLFKLSDYGEAEATKMVLFSIMRGSVGLIMNGDHKQEPKQSSGGRPKVKLI